MEKLLVGLRVPAVRKEYDIFVPQDVEIGTLISLLADSVAQLSDGEYVVSGAEMLTMTNPEALLHPERCLKDYQLKDGARLILL